MQHFSVASAAASALPAASILLLIPTLFCHVTTAAATFTRLGDAVPSNHTLNDTSLNINSHLCDSNLPSQETAASGNASIPLAGPGAVTGVGSVSDQNFMVWSIFTEEASTNQTFYFTSPRNVLNIDSNAARNSNSSCYLDRLAIGNGTSSRAGSGTVDCISVLGHDCVNALSQISASLSNDTLGELQNVSTLVCRVDRETGAELGLAQCKSIASLSGDNGGQLAGNGSTDGANGMSPSNNLGLILGPVLGGVGLVALILGVIFFFRRRSRRATARRNNDDYAMNTSFTNPFASGGRSNAIKLKTKPTAASLGSSGSEAGLPPPSDLSIEEIRPMSNPSDAVSHNSRSQLFNRDQRAAEKGRGAGRNGE